MNVWIIARRERRTSGHGESSTITELATIGWSENEYHPAFTRLEDAEKYIRDERARGFPVRLTVK